VIVYWLIYKLISRVSEYLIFIKWSERSHISLNFLLSTRKYYGMNTLMVARIGDVLDLKLEEKLIASRFKIRRFLEMKFEWRCD